MMQTTVPKEHRDLGRKTKFDREVWDQGAYRNAGSTCLAHNKLTLAEKSRIVEEGNYHKFTKSENASEML